MEFKLLILNTLFATANMIMLHLICLAPANKSFKEVVYSNQIHFFVLSFIGWPIFFIIYVSGVVIGLFKTFLRRKS